MRKIIIYLFIFTNTFTTLCQSRNGSIEYRYKIEGSYIPEEFIQKEKDPNLKSTLAFLNSSLKNNQNKLLFTLNFNKEKSIYFMNKILKVDNDRELNFAIITNRGKQVFIQDSAEKKVIYKTTIFGEDFYVKSSLESLDWELKRDTKKIGNFTCYKAVAFLNTKTKITAWYTPEIPNRFGPKGIGGLPGLILELKEKNIIYYAQKISLNLSNNIEIELPENEKIISRKKFDSIGNSFKNRYKIN